MTQSNVCLFPGGEQFGPYQIDSLIGAGGMGEVWRARDTRLDRVVAIKQLKSRHTARFQQEARAIAVPNHPHISQIHDIGPDYLVLEYVEGRDLRGPLGPEDAVRLGIRAPSFSISAWPKWRTLPIAVLPRPRKAWSWARPRTCHRSRRRVRRLMSARMCSASGRFRTRCWRAGAHSPAAPWRR